MRSEREAVPGSKLHLVHPKKYSASHMTALPLCACKSDDRDSEKDFALKLESHENFFSLHLQLIHRTCTVTTQSDRVVVCELQGY